MDDFLRWNNIVVSAKSAALAIEGVPYTGILKLDYEDQLDIETVHGMNRNGAPIGHTSGEYSVSSFNFSVLKDVWMMKLLPQLLVLGTAAGSPGSYGAARFTFTAQYQEGPMVGVDAIQGGRIIKVKDAIDQGTGKLVVECGCAAIMVRRNGMTLFDQTRLP